MANPQHLEILQQGVAIRNAWREQNPSVLPDFRKANIETLDLENVNLREADFRQARIDGVNFGFADLQRADFREAHIGWYLIEGYGEVRFTCADLQGADFRQASLIGVNLSGADLRQATLSEAQLTGVDLSGTNLRGCNLQRAKLPLAKLVHADLSHADLSDVSLEQADICETDASEAILCGADLWRAKLSFTNLEGTNLTECHLSATYDENLRLDGAIQQDFVIGPGYPKPARILVDQFEVAQFFSYVLEHSALSRMIQRIDMPVVLLVGNFSGERKAVAQGIKEELRQRDVIPMTFSVEEVVPPRFGELIAQLLRWVRFVFVDGTSVPILLQELQRILPELPAVPLQPFWQGSATADVFQEIKRYPQVLSPFTYSSADDVIRSLPEDIFDRLEQMAL